MMEPTTRPSISVPNLLSVISAGGTARAARPCQVKCRSDAMSFLGLATTIGARCPYFGGTYCGAEPKTCCREGSRATGSKVAVTLFSDQSAPWDGFPARRAKPAVHRRWRKCVICGDLTRYRVCWQSASRSRLRIVGQRRRTWAKRSEPFRVDKPRKPARFGAETVDKLLTYRRPQGVLRFDLPRTGKRLHAPCHIS